MFPKLLLVGFGVMSRTQFEKDVLYIDPLGPARLAHLCWQRNDKQYASPFAQLGIRVDELDARWLACYPGGMTVTRFPRFRCSTMTGRAYPSISGYAMLVGEARQRSSESDLLSEARQQVWLDSDTRPINLKWLMPW